MYVYHFLFHQVLFYAVFDMQNSDLNEKNMLQKETNKNK